VLLDLEHHLHYASRVTLSLADAPWAPGAFRGPSSFLSYADDDRIAVRYLLAVTASRFPRLRFVRRRARQPTSSHSESTERAHVPFQPFLALSPECAKTFLFSPVYPPNARRVLTRHNFPPLFSFSLRRCSLRFPAFYVLLIKFPPGRGQR